MLRPAPLALLLLLASPAGAATVLSVGDGDTLRDVDGSKRLTIRIACIDAPETAQRPYAAASRQRLQELAPVGSGGGICPIKGIHLNSDPSITWVAQALLSCKSS